jgi:hypothetical protein
MLLTLFVFLLIFLGGYAALHGDRDIVCAVGGLLMIVCVMGWLKLRAWRYKKVPGAKKEEPKTFVDKVKAAVSVKVEEAVAAITKKPPAPVAPTHSIDFKSLGYTEDESARMVRDKASVGAVTVTLFWNEESDLDLHVKAPAERGLFSRLMGSAVEEIAHNNREAKKKGGGRLDVDANSGAGKATTTPIENIFFGDHADKGADAPKGKYTVEVENFQYRGDLSSSRRPVPWTVRVVWFDNDPEASVKHVVQVYQGQCVGEGRASREKAGEFIYKGKPRRWSWWPPSWSS